MIIQVKQSDLITELSSEEQQLLSGGCCNCSPRYKPRKCGGYNSYNDSMPYMTMDYSTGY
jgi:hypothetical protein